MRPYVILREALKRRLDRRYATRHRVAALEARVVELASALQTAAAAAEAAQEARAAARQAQLAAEKTIALQEDIRATIVEKTEAAYQAATDAASAVTRLTGRTDTAHRVATEAAGAVSRLVSSRANDAHRLATETARAVEQLWQAEIELWQTIDSLAEKTDETLVQSPEAGLAPGPAARS